MNKNVAFLVILFLTLHFTLVVCCIKLNSPTCDEIAHHIASGYSYLIMRDFRMNPANPPLIREISAFPLLFLNLRLPTDLSSWAEGNSPLFGKQFFYELNKNADEIIFWARIPVAILSVILGFLVFLWSSKLYGHKGGLLSIVLYTLSPNIVTFAGLATTDLGSALFVFSALLTFWIYISQPNLKNLVLAGICFGLAQASKYTNIHLVLIFIMITLGVYIFKNKQHQNFRLIRLTIKLFFIFLIGALVVFASYFFEIKPLLKNAPDVPEKISYIEKFVDKFSFLEKVSLNKQNLIYFAQNIPMPFSTYIVGLLGMLHQGIVGLDTFLLGRHSQTGFWNYFLVAFLVKSTVVTILLFVFGIVLLFRHKMQNLKNELFLIVPIILFFLIMSLGKVQVGVRHILQIYPLIFVFVGKLSQIKIKDGLKYIAFALVVAWQFGSLMSVYPYPIAYFNEIAGGPSNGYKILRDSNLDWGQGLIALKKYIDANKIDKIKLFYFGTADPDYYNISHEDVTEAELKIPQKGIYAISAQYLDTVGWTKNNEPTEKIAYSIFIYKF